MFIAANVMLLYYLDMDWYFLHFLSFLNMCSIDVSMIMFYSKYYKLLLSLSQIKWNY